MYTDVVWQRREPLHGRGVGRGGERTAVRGVVGYEHPHGRGVARLDVPVPHTMHQTNDFRKSTPAQNRQLIVQLVLAAVRGVVGDQHPHGRSVARLGVPAGVYETGITSKLSGNEVHYNSSDKEHAV